MTNPVGFPECYTAIDPDSVRAVDVDDAGRPAAIEVSGHTRGCPTVIFELDGLGGVTPVTVQGSDPQGALTPWVEFDVTFDLDHQHDVCGRQITIVARCQDDPDCEQQLTLTLECEGCPQVHDLSATALGCDELNTIFRLRATISGFRPPGTRVFWRFGDGPTSRSEDIELQATIADEVVEVQHAYAPPGPYQASLEFATRPGCAGAEVVVPADQFLDCVADAPDCPTVTLSARPTDAGDACDDRERRSMTLTVTTTDLPTPRMAYWDFGDDNFSAPFNLLLDQPQSVQHDYDVPGTYQATLNITDCSPQTLTVDVTTPCPPPPPPVDDCPVVDFSATLEEGCSEPGRRKVTLSVVVQSAPQPRAAQLDFGDGSPVVDGFIVAGQSFETDHMYETGGVYTARLSIQDCDEEQVTVDVSAPCPDDDPPPPPPPPPPPECPEGQTFDPLRGACVPNWVPITCPILFWMAMGLLALAAALAVIWGCLTPAAIPVLVASIITFIFALIFLIIWLALCARFFCIVVNTVRKILAALALLSVIGAAIVAVVGQLPCSIGLIISFGYFGVFYTIVTEVSFWIGCAAERNE